MPEDRAFIDTNILIYAYNETYPDKRQKAQEAIDRYESILSTQVLNEFSNASLYSLKTPHKEIVNIIQEIIENHIVIPINVTTIIKALLLQERYQYSYYDCIMLASALANGCKIILSEDMQHKQLIENSLTILNPFR